MRRVTFFVKGNVDVHDSLHSCRVGGEVVWNGINAVLRAERPDVLARIKHETWTRSDALLALDGRIPEELAVRDPPLGYYPLTSQFQTQIFDTKADAFILSIQPDVATGLLRHKSAHYLFYPSEASKWSEQDRLWLKASFQSLGHLTVEQSIGYLTAIVERIRTGSDAPILIYNLSPVVPGESVHCYREMGEILSNRIRRFNLGLVALSEGTGISVVDVDSLLARRGADELKVDAMHLTAKGYELVSREVVRLLDDLGLWDG
jgi:hypothetical protein